MKKNSPRKKNVSKKRNTSKKKSYPEANYVTETGAIKKTRKKRYVKKNKNKIDFKEYLRKKAKAAWDARDVIIFVAVMLGFLASLHFMTSYNRAMNPLSALSPPSKSLNMRTPTGPPANSKRKSAESSNQANPLMVSPSANTSRTLRRARNIGRTSPSIPETMNSTSASSALKRSKNNPTPQKGSHHGRYRRLYHRLF